MINFEWFRTFRTVYKTQSLTKAAAHLMITQPAVSQHLAALENHTGKKLFIRKSKGVIPSDYARTLNNMIAHSLDDLEEVEGQIGKRSIKNETVINIGISEHLYKSILSGIISDLNGKVHISFGTSDKLIKDTEEGNLNYAIVPELVNNFDTDCFPFLSQNLILVHTPDIELSEFENLFENDKRKAERWLSKQNWYSHRTITPFIKQFWMECFNKKRPDIVPYRVVPNENEVLKQLSFSSGLALCFDNNALSYLKKGTLLKSKISSSVKREVSLIANRKKKGTKFTESLLGLLQNLNI